MIKPFPIYRQLDTMDCGPTCLRMVAKYYGKHYTLETLREYSFLTKEGVTISGLEDAATKLGFTTQASKLTFNQLDNEATLPCILHWNQNHFVVLPPQNYDINNPKSKILIADPAHGLIKITKEAFLHSWLGGEEYGITLLLEPTSLFHTTEDEKIETKKGIIFLAKYLIPYRKYIIQLLFGMIVASLLSLIAPFLIQSTVDYGISQHNMDFVSLMLLSQIGVFLGTTTIEIIRNWLLLHMSTRINISIISDFLAKLMKLPIHFFDKKMTGDIIQRIYDHTRIEQFLTGTSINTLFSIINLLIFSIVLYIYSLPILVIFFFGSAFSIYWLLFFQKKRKELDYARFQNMSDNQDNILEIITGMQEIKLNNGEKWHRKQWEKIQLKLFKINIKSLILSQYQNTGAVFFVQLKNILISFFSAQEVINGNISMGMMLSISYITGQMNAPISQLFNFFQTAQDAKISLDRLSEIHTREDEEKENLIFPDKELESLLSSNKKTEGIILENVSFQYGGAESSIVLDNINLIIPVKKVTAIVGASGSGKSTLMKLLLKFYAPTKGNIYIGNSPLNAISPNWWRKHCGIVMSDGYIFSNTIAQNISVHDQIDQTKLVAAVKLSNMEEFIHSLPKGYSTKIGNTGIGISSGQRQRILIARAVYKDPSFLFLDEATSTLDSKNERLIVENLSTFFSDRTVVVIAHRLSTVKNADQIVVMESGKIVEIGNHKTLLMKKGKYYELIKNQLES